MAALTNLDKQKNTDNQKTRAKRLKQVRRLLNMDREEFAEYCHFNTVTYKDWETARRNTIPAAKADELFDYLKKEGIFVSLEWFLKGAGPEPYRVLNWHDKEGVSQHEISDVQILIAEDVFIKKELSLFLINHADATWFILPDDTMAPFYQKGDVVAGIQYQSKDFHRLIGKDCIVHVNHQPLLRKVQAGRETGLYSLIATQVISGQEQIIYDVKLELAAPVVWLRRNVIF